MRVAGLFKNEKVKKSVCILLTIVFFLVAVFLFLKSINGFVPDNKVKLNFNDGNVMFNGSIETQPGAEIETQVFIENVGSLSAFYKIYLEDIDGELKEQVFFNVSSGGETLFDGKMTELNEENPIISKKAIKSGEKVYFTVKAKMSSYATNEYTSSQVTFNCRVDAVKADNNPSAKFA